LGELANCENAGNDVHHANEVLCEEDAAGEGVGPTGRSERVNKHKGNAEDYNYDTAYNGLNNNAHMGEPGNYRAEGDLINH
jgi:hypothetical protein